MAAAVEEYTNQYIRWFTELSIADVPSVGGKNAGLGELTKALKELDIRVPEGFATTAAAYRFFLESNDLVKPIRERLDALKSGAITLQQAGTAIRRLLLAATIPQPLADEVCRAYRSLSARYNASEVDVAVRSSATAEDLPTASFAGQQETFLNIVGEQDVLDACRRCFASLFKDRAISYRAEHGFDDLDVALSIGIQKMVRSDLAGAGVIFTLDTETGFPNVIVINAAWGLGEIVVQGAVQPDEYRVFTPLVHQDGLMPIIEKQLGEKAHRIVYGAGGGKATKTVVTPLDDRRSFVLSDAEILQLARWADKIAKHFGRPMDIEWAKDGQSGEIFFVQARPETVQSQRSNAALRTYTLKERPEPVLKGVAIGEAIAAGKACVIKHASEIEQFEDGAILVTGMTDPDWVPIMKRAAGIITDFGGRTSHAAIVSRELGIPAVVGTGHATSTLLNGQAVTLSCAEGEEGYVYQGALAFEATDINMENVPDTRTRIMLNIASPDAAMRWWRLPCRGIGLARMEFIISNVIKIHPMALVKFDELTDPGVRRQIERLTHEYADKTEYFVENLARGIAKIAASQYPEPVIVRMSDFKTNEYANLLGGKQFEPVEENPMLGWRGASRYYSEGYRAGFALECRAIKRVREEIGLDNVIVMIPFCRTVEEADRVLAVMADCGLKRGDHGLAVYVMCEIPSNVILAAQFAARFDGFSIGSNDLTQLALGIDRDSAALASLFDERNEAVKWLIRHVIAAAHAEGAKVGICGQAPSDYPDFAAFLVEAGIDSISLNPDSVMGVIQRVAKMERTTAAQIYPSHDSLDQSAAIRALHLAFERLDLLYEQFQDNPSVERQLDAQRLDVHKHRLELLEAELSAMVDQDSPEARLLRHDIIKATHALVRQRAWYSEKYRELAHA